MNEAERQDGVKRMTAREMWAFFGPAFVASVAYIDPGNFASNIVGGARYGYTLLWVLLWSNAMAMLVQYLSAKLGIATGKTLPRPARACRWSASAWRRSCGGGQKIERRKGFHSRRRWWRRPAGHAGIAHLPVAVETLMSVGVPLAQVLVASPGKGMQVERIRLASELWAADKN